MVMNNYIELDRIIICRNGEKTPIEKGDYVTIKSPDSSFNMIVHGFQVEPKGFYPSNYSLTNSYVFGKVDEDDPYFTYARAVDCYLI